ncbi:unnamed protein product, partial [Diamesa hyperborea]
MDYSKKPQKKNPRKGASSLSQLLFLWVLPLMFKGCCHGLGQTDLTKSLKQDRSEDLGDKLETNWERELTKSRKKNKKPMLRNALFYTFYASCIFDGFLVFCFVLLNFDFLIFMWNDVFWLSTIIVLMTLLACFVNHHMDLRQRLVGARMRIACCSVIYRKTLRMSKRAAGQTSAGNVVNLLSNDVSRLDYGFIYVHFIWILPFQSVLICYLIWREVKYAAIVGVVGLLLKTIPVQTGLSRLSSIIRLHVAQRTDRRVSIMNELIQGIQVIKMYAWEIPFRNVVKLARKKEVDQIKWASYIRGIYLSTMVFTERSTLFIAIVACVVEGIPITADVVFSMAQFFNILQLTCAIFYPMAVSLGAEALVSIKRVQDFLMIEEQDTFASNGMHRNDLEIIEPEANVVEMENVYATWTDDYKKKTLEELNMKIQGGKLTAIIGGVGSGKSSILQLLLGELPIYSGDVIINGDFSYGSQEAWIFSGTIKNNILFGLPYDKQRYKETIKYCALLTDFQQLPDGDKTFVGERGSSLSGGQKARISLARAVYKKSSIYLLDDPLSAVDSNVARLLFDECIGPNGYLAQQKASRILVTHQVHFLKEADWIIVMDDGKILKQGSYNDVMDLDLSQFVSPPGTEDEKDNEEDDDAEYEEDEIPYIDGADVVGGYAKLRMRSSGSIKSQKKSTSRVSVNGSMGDSILSVDGGQMVAEDQAQSTIGLGVWWSYFRSGGGIIFLIFVAVFLLFSQIVTSGSDYFVTFWTNQEYLRLLSRPTLFSTIDGLYIYGFLIVAVILVTLLRGYFFFGICMRASKNLHDRMFAAILAAPCRFFDTNPSGRILNRFSKDMGAIDEQLPKAMIEAMQILLVMVGILLLIAVVNSLLLIPLAIATILFGLVLKLYMRTAQDLKRLEGITKSPVFSHLAATLSGISTIRANKAESRLTLEFDGLQNVHSSVWQQTMTTNTALGLYMDMISCAFVACVTFSFIILVGNTASSNVGLAISQALILTGMVQYGIRQSTESMQQMTSVERVLAYTNLEQEKLVARKPTLDWPFKGGIEFKNMSLYYDVNALPTLKQMSVVIEPGSKIGIVGRTGAGKSSLIAALFRLAHIDGYILIDGIETGEINLESLRSKISIIPQDPVLFSASIRYNLDPFDAYEDVDIWNALESVELKSSISGLQFMVTESGSNFSVGQRQLLCLARAILRNNKILVLDEATANVDPKTDALIQRTIRQKFTNCTVLTIAHRLFTVMDSDKIMVMDNGFLKEYDIPYKLIQQPFGLFKDIIAATGESENLIKIAK